MQSQSDICIVALKHDLTDMTWTNYCILLWTTMNIICNKLRPYSLTVHILGGSSLILYVEMLIWVMVLCFVNTMDLSTVAIGTQCIFYPRSLAFVMVFLICSSLMVSPCHGMSWTLLCCIWRRIGKLRILLFLYISVYFYVRLNNLLP